MVWKYLLCIMGKSTKVVENVNQNYSEEWNSHIHGVLLAAKSALAVMGGMKAPQRNIRFSFSLCSSSSWSTFTHQNSKARSIGLRKKK